MHHVPLVVQCIYGWSDEGGEDGNGKEARFMKDGREWRLPDLFVDDLVLCSESEEDLRAVVERFAEVCRRRGFKVNADKNIVMVLNGVEGLECEVHVDGVHLELVSEFKYLVGCVFKESGTDRAESSRKVSSGKRIAGAIRSLVNARDLLLECARVLHETFACACPFVWL